MEHHVGSTGAEDGKEPQTWSGSPEADPCKAAPAGAPGPGPAAAPSSQTLQITILRARGLRLDGAAGEQLHGVFCSCTVMGKARSKFITKVTHPRHLEWHHEDSIVDFQVGDNLLFGVWGEGWQNLGSAMLESEQFLPSGFDGELTLSEAGRALPAFLAIRVALAGGVGSQEDAAQPGRSWPPVAEAANAARRAAAAAASVSQLGAGPDEAAGRQPAKARSNTAPASAYTITAVPVPESEEGGEIGADGLEDARRNFPTWQQHQRQRQATATYTQIASGQGTFHAPGHPVRSGSPAPALSSGSPHASPSRGPKSRLGMAAAAACGKEASGLDDKEDTEERDWNERQAKTGCVGRLVSYAFTECPQADFLLRGGCGRRIMVAQVTEGGKAQRAGVKAGDMLVSIDGRRDFQGQPGELLHASLLAPVTLVFMGFVGRPTAEVQLTNQWPVAGMSSDLQVYDEWEAHKVTVVEQVVFRPGGSSVMLATDCTPAASAASPFSPRCSAASTAAARCGSPALCSCPAGSATCCCAGGAARGPTDARGRSPSPTAIFELKRTEALSVIRRALSPPSMPPKNGGTRSSPSSSSKPQRGTSARVAMPSLEPQPQVAAEPHHRRPLSPQASDREYQTPVSVRVAPPAPEGTPRADSLAQRAAATLVKEPPEHSPSLPAAATPQPRRSPCGELGPQISPRPGGFSSPGGLIARPLVELMGRGQQHCAPPLRATLPRPSPFLGRERQGKSPQPERKRTSAWV